MPRPRHTVEDFWTFVDRSTGENGCWNWIGPFMRDKDSDIPICQFYYQYRQWRAHIFSYYYFKEKFDLKRIGKDAHIIQTCKNRFCVNPNHLMLSTKYIDVDFL